VSIRAPRAVVVDTMAVSALMNASRNPQRAAAYRRAINDDSVLVSFVTITELRFGALRAGWGELRRRGLERDLARLVVVQPDDQLMRTCAEIRASCSEPDTDSATRSTKQTAGSQRPQSASPSTSSPTTPCSATCPISP
jgi:predicted nucleic acid-binding protein